MKYELRILPSFKRDIKLLRKQGKSLDKLDRVIQMLLNGEPLPDRCRNHKLTGNYNDFWECHIAPDWLLIYLIDDNILTLTLTRTGSHSELFS